MDTSLEYHKFPEDYISLTQPIEYIDYIEKHMTKMDCYQDENNKIVFSLNKENDNQNSIQPECKTKKRKPKKQTKRLVSEVDKENIIIHPVNIANINRMVLRENSNIGNIVSIKPGTSNNLKSFKQTQIEYDDELNMIDLTQNEDESDDKENNLNLTRSGKEGNYNLNEFALELTNGLFNKDELKTCKFLLPSHNRKNLKRKPFDADSVEILKSSLICFFLFKTIK